jgi:hypothetical protein
MTTLFLFCHAIRIASEFRGDSIYNILIKNIFHVKIWHYLFIYTIYVFSTKDKAMEKVIFFKKIIKNNWCKFWIFFLIKKFWIL